MQTEMREIFVCSEPILDAQVESEFNLQTFNVCVQVRIVKTTFMCAKGDSREVPKGSQMHMLLCCYIFLWVVFYLSNDITRFKLYKLSP